MATLRTSLKTNENVPIHPPDVDTEDGLFVKDAYAELFTVQPSTRAQLSKSRTPLYVVDTIAASPAHCAGFQRDRRSRPAHAGSSRTRPPRGTAPALCAMQPRWPGYVLDA